MVDWSTLEKYENCPLGSPDEIKKYMVYQYQHLDTLDFMPKATDVLEDTSRVEECIAAAKARLTEGGWEGDGELQVMWLPPFLGAGIESSHGVLIWHVKQRNNGTSFLASPVPLNFKRLLDQQ